MTTFVAGRKFALDLDLAVSSTSAKEKVATTKSKMDEENDEKKPILEREEKRGKRRKIRSSERSLLLAWKTFPKVLFPLQKIINVW